MRIFIIDIFFWVFSWDSTSRNWADLSCQACSDVHSDGWLSVWTLLNVSSSSCSGQELHYRHLRWICRWMCMSCIWLVGLFWIRWIKENMTESIPLEPSQLSGNNDRGWQIWVQWLWISSWVSYPYLLVTLILEDEYLDAKKLLFIPLGLFSLPKLGRVTVGKVYCKSSDRAPKADWRCSQT